MIVCLIALGCCGASALFDVHSIPLATPETTCFLAEMDDDGTADLFTVSGNTVTVYPNAESNPAASIQLPNGSSAIDVADITGTGKCELLVICGERILQYSLLTPISEPKELFSLKTLFAEPAPCPYTHVLIIKRGGTPLFALPRESAFELRGIDGRLIESYPISVDAPHSIAYGKPFSWASVVPPYIGLPESLELNVHRTLAIKPNLPPDLLAVEMMGPMYRRPTFRQLREAANANPETWPAFPLRKTDGQSEKVNYALDTLHAENTLISIQQPSTDTSKALIPGPIRQYPGIPFFTEEVLPDFNADGCHDLVLWRSPSSAPTMDSLTRIALGGTWPFLLEAHLYIPAKRRFEAKVSSNVSISMPLRWFVAGPNAAGPKLAFLRDANGDGTSDFGCATDSNTYSVWRYTKNGFSNTPDFTFSAPEPLEGIERQADLDGRGRTSILLRTSKTLHVLKAAAPVSFPRPPAKPVP